MSSAMTTRTLGRVGSAASDRAGRPRNTNAGRMRAIITASRWLAIRRCGARRKLLVQRFSRGLQGIRILREIDAIDQLVRVGAVVIVLGPDHLPGLPVAPFRVTTDDGPNAVTHCIGDA